MRPAVARHAADQADDTLGASILSPRFLLYSHDGFGVGHLARNLRVGGALGRLLPHSSTLLACGLSTGAPLPRGVDVLKLPSMHKVGQGRYEARFLRTSPADLRELRMALLEQTVRSFRPDVVLVDRHPEGLGGELRPALDLAQAAGAALVLGLRDVLDEPATIAAEWPAHVHAEIATRFDEVLVYAEHDGLDFAREYDLPAPLAAKLRYVGLVGPRPPSGQRPRRASDDPDVPFVVASVGGGEDGHRLLSAVLAGAAGAGWQGVALTGPHMPAEDRGSLQPLAERSGLRLMQHEPDVPGLLRRADVSVSMAGANTVSEILSTGCRSVLLPRARPRTEQLIRARLLERSGRAIVVHPDDATPGTIRRAVERALATPAPTPMELTGAYRAARALASLAMPAAALGVPA